jgi:heme/copper-type cytochrome/quinol oxidase subunit 2
MKKIIISIVLFLTFLNSNAQCAMCKAVVESGGDTSQAEGLNTGIIYLMVFPYLLVGVLLYFIIKYRKKFKI